MTWTARSNIVLNNDNKASSSTTSTGAQSGYLPVVGDVIVVTFAFDNIATANGDTTNVNSVTDSKGNAYYKIREYTNAQGAAAAGVTLTKWICLRVAFAWDSATTITAAHTAATGRSIRAAAYTPTNANGGFLDPTTAFNVGTGADPASFSLTPSAGNREYLWLYGLGAEGPAGDTDTVDSTNGWTRNNFNGTTGSTAQTNISEVSGYKISTAASLTVDWTHTAQDNTQILAAVIEAPAVLAAPPVNWLDSFQHQIALAASNLFYGTNAGVYDSTNGTALMTYPTGRHANSMAFQIAQDGLTSARMGKTVAAGNRVVVESFYFKVSAAPSVNSNFWLGLATVNSQVQMLTTGGVQYNAGSGTSKDVNGGANLADGQWHRIDLRFNTSQNFYQIELWLDGVAQPTQISNATTAADITETRLGSNNGAHTLTIQYADWVRSVASNDFPIGPHRCMAIHPTGDGTHSYAGTNMGSETGGVASSVTTLWQSVDDWATGAANQTDYIQYANTTATSTEYAEITLADTTETTVWAAKAVAGLLSASTLANSATTRIVNAANATVLDLYVGDQSDTILRQQASMLPGINTPTLLNGLKFRVGFPTDSNPAPYWTALMVEYVVPGEGTQTVQKTFTGAITPAGLLGPDTTGKTFVGAMTPSGLLGPDTTGKTFVGAMTPAGSFARLKVSLKTLSGGMTPSATLQKQTAKPLTGSITPTTALQKLTAKLLTGALTPAGVLLKLRSKLLSGAVTPAGALVKQSTKTTAGSMTPAGALVKSTAKTLVGAITPTGAFARLKVSLKTLSGSLTASGVLSRAPQKTLTGTITPTGAMSKVLSFFRTLAGSITPTGVLARQYALKKTFSGSITPTATFAQLKVILRTFSGSITPTGVLAKTLSSLRTFTGTVTPSGVKSLLVQKTVTGSITPTGVSSRLKVFIRNFSGSITPAATLVRSVSKTLAGAIAPTGVVVKSLAKAFAGTVTPAGALTKLKANLKTFVGSITPSGALQRGQGKTFTGTVTPTASINKRINKTYVGGITPTGTFVKGKASLKTFSGGITPAGVLGPKKTIKLLYGFLTPVGAFSKTASIVAGELLGEGYDIIVERNAYTLVAEVVLEPIATRMTYTLVAETEEEVIADDNTYSG